VDGGANNHVRLGSDTNCADPQIIQLQARVPYQSFFLHGVLPNSASITLSAEHEERSIAR
jgi:hypothetical protein